MIEIDIQVEVLAEPHWHDLLRRAVLATLAHQDWSQPATLNILLTDDATIQQMNRDFRGYDKPTDVLSFEDGTPPFPNALIHLGDMAISVPYALRDAEKMGWGESAEILLIGVHSTLHLLGHDHLENDDKARMWAAQREILLSLGVDIVID